MCDILQPHNSGRSTWIFQAASPAVGATGSFGIVFSLKPLCTLNTTEYNTTVLNTMVSLGGSAKTKIQPFSGIPVNIYRTFKKRNQASAETSTQDS